MKHKKSIFSSVMVLFWFSLYAYVPQMTNYAKEMGASYKLIGLIAGAYGFSQTILRIPLGILSDKLNNRKIFILIGLFSAILSALLVYIFPSPITLLVGRLLAGVASATWVNFTVLFISYFKPFESAKAIGIATSNSKIGQLFAMFIGGFLAIKYDVRSIFLMSIIFGAIAFLLGFFIAEDNTSPINEKEKIPGSILTVIKDKRILQLSFLGSLVQFISYSTSFGFTPLIANNIGANNLQLSYLSVVYTLPQILFSIISGTILVKKLGVKNTLLLGFGMTTVTCFITPFVPNLILLYTMQFVSGVGNAITFPLLMSMVIKDVDKNLMTTTMGFYQAAYGVGMILGPIILGSVGDLFGLTYGFIVVGLLSMVSIWSVIRMEI